MRTTSSNTIIVVIYNTERKIRSVSRYMESVPIQEAVCRTLERFCGTYKVINDLEINCFEFPIDSFIPQIFPEPSAELSMLLDKLDPCLRIPLIQAYWLYMNGYSPLAENLSDHVQESILLFEKYLHIQECGDSILGLSEKEYYSNLDFAVTGIIASASGNIRLCNDIIDQLGSIEDKCYLESCLATVWRYLDKIHPEDAMKLLQLWSRNQLFRELLLTDDFCNYFRNDCSSLEAILKINKDKRNAAHRSVLALSLLPMQNEQVILQRMIMDMEHTCKSIPTLFVNDKLPICHYDERIQKLLMEKKDIINKITEAISNNSTMNQTDGNYIARTRKLFNTPDKYRLDKTIRMFSEWSLLSTKKRMFNDALSLFYQSCCWESEPEYAFIVQSVLLSKLSSLKSLPFPLDMQRILHMKDSDVPNCGLLVYLDVLTAYTLQIHSENMDEIMGVLRKARNRVLSLTEKVKRPLSYLSPFSDAILTGVIRFLAETDDKKKGLFYSAMKEYGLEKLFDLVHYRFRGGKELSKLVESRSAETLLFCIIRSLSFIIPHACDKGLVFKGWYDGIVKLNDGNNLKLSELQKELSLDHKAEMLHAVFVNDKHKLFTDVDIYVHVAISQYDGADITEVEQERLEKAISDMEDTEYSISPGTVFFLREKSILSDWVRLCQLKKHVFCINNLMEKNTLQTEIFLLMNSIKKKIGSII